MGIFDAPLDISFEQRDELLACSTAEELPQRMLLDRIVGKGGFAVVWRAVFDGSVCACKVLQPRGGALPPPAIVRLFVRECSSLMAMDHSAVIRCFGLVQLRAADWPELGLGFDTYGMLLEFCEGGTLKDLLVGQAMTMRDAYSLREALAWLTQVAGALLQFHSLDMPIIHRDIKPDNVLLQALEHDAAAAADFSGSSRHAPSTKAAAATARSLLHASGASGGGGGDTPHMGSRRSHASASSNTSARRPALEAKLADLGLGVRVGTDRHVLIRRRSTTILSANHEAEAAEALGELKQLMAAGAEAAEGVPLSAGARAGAAHGEREFGAEAGAGGGRSGPARGTPPQVPYGAAADVPFLGFTTSPLPSWRIPRLGSKRVAELSASRRSYGGGGALAAAAAAAVAAAAAAEGVHGSGLSGAALHKGALLNSIRVRASGRRDSGCSVDGAPAGSSPAPGSSGPPSPAPALGGGLASLPSAKPSNLGPGSPMRAAQTPPPQPASGGSQQQLHPFRDFNRRSLPEEGANHHANGGANHHAPGPHNHHLDHLHHLRTNGSEGPFQRASAGATAAHDAPHSSHPPSPFLLANALSSERPPPGPSAAAAAAAAPYVTTAESGATPAASVPSAAPSAASPSSAAAAAGTAHFGQSASFPRENEHGSAAAGSGTLGGGRGALLPPISERSLSAEDASSSGLNAALSAAYASAAAASAAAAGGADHAAATSNGGAAVSDAGVILTVPGFAPSRRNPLYTIQEPDDSSRAASTMPGPSAAATGHPGEAPPPRPSFLAGLRNSFFRGSGERGSGGGAAGGGAPPRRISLPGGGPSKGAAHAEAAGAEEGGHTPGGQPMRLQPSQSMPANPSITAAAAAAAAGPGAHPPATPAAPGSPPAVTPASSAPTPHGSTPPLGRVPTGDASGTTHAPSSSRNPSRASRATTGLAGPGSMGAPGSLPRSESVASSRATRTQGSLGLRSASSMLRPNLRQLRTSGSVRKAMRRIDSLLKTFNKPTLPKFGRESQYQWVFGLTGQAGSCMYMAPEVYCAEPYNEKVDVFSYGVMMYELLARKLLLIEYIGGTRAGNAIGVRDPQQYANKVANGFRPPRSPRIPEDLWALICECWHADPLERPDMGEVASRLAAIAADWDWQGAPGSTRSGPARATTLGPRLSLVSGAPSAGFLPGPGSPGPARSAGAGPAGGKAPAAAAAATGKEEAAGSEGCQCVIC